MVRTMTDEAIIAKYQVINQTINQLGNRLITKLAKYGVNKNHESFTNLIHSIGEIEAVEKYYNNNTEPIEPNLVPITYANNKYSSEKSLIEYNDSLIQKIVFYIKLLKYYLALKGIDLDIVNNTNTVAGLIELIDFIDAILATNFTISNTTTEYYAGEELTIFYKLIDSENNPVENGEIDIYDNNVLISTIIAGNTIAYTPNSGSHNIRLVYKGTDKYKQSEVSWTFVVKPGRIRLDTIIANQTSSSVYYRSADTGFSNDSWYISLLTKNIKDEVLPNVPLTIKDVLYDEEGEIVKETILTNNAITDGNGAYTTSGVILSDYGNHSIVIETQYVQTDIISNTKEEYSLNITHDIFYTQYPFNLYYETQPQSPIVIELHDESGEKPYNESTNTYLYDGTPITVSILNILSEEVILTTTKIVTNGQIEIPINLPVGYYHILLDCVLGLSINYADIHFNTQEYTIDIGAINIGIDDATGEEINNVIEQPPEEEESGEGTVYDYEGDNEEYTEETQKYHVYGLFIIDVRENLDLIKNATNNNGDIVISTSKILTAINNNDTNFIQSLYLSNDKILAESVIKDENKTIALNLEEAIGKIKLNDDKNIEYERVGDIYSLDNRKLQYNRQQG